jgi:hypothetical protein
MENRKILTLSGLEPSAVHPVASRYTDCAIPALISLVRTYKLSNEMDLIC